MPALAAPAPPVEEKLAWLPQQRSLPGAYRGVRTVVRQSKAQHEQYKAAQAAAVRTARGDSARELAEALQRECDLRHLRPSPTELVMRVRALSARTSVVSGVRGTFEGLRMLKDLGGHVASAVRATVPDEQSTGAAASWLTPPTDACYPPPHGPGRWAGVELGAHAEHVLTRLQRRLGPLTLVTALIDDDAAGPPTVHLGDVAVGALPAQPGDELAAHLRAARFYGERVTLHGRIARRSRTSAPYWRFGFRRRSRRRRTDRSGAAPAAGRGFGPTSCRFLAGPFDVFVTGPAGGPGERSRRWRSTWC